MVKILLNTSVGDDSGNLDSSLGQQGFGINELEGVGVVWVTVHLLGLDFKALGLLSLAQVYQ